MNINLMSAFQHPLLCTKLTRSGSTIYTKSRLFQAHSLRRRISLISSRDVKRDARLANRYQLPHPGLIGHVSGFPLAAPRDLFLQFCIHPRDVRPAPSPPRAGLGPGPSAMLFSSLGGSLGGLAVRHVTVEASRWPRPQERRGRDAGPGKRSIRGRQVTGSEARR